MNADHLIQWIHQHVDSTYPLHSRVHPLHSFPKGAQWFVKRDDELSFGISGSKYRKYASLIPYLKQNHYQKVHLVGSAHSNHLVSILQLLNEHQIPSVVYILKPAHTSPQGNYSFLKLLLGNNPLHLLSKEEWPHRDSIISRALSSSCIYIPEGGELFESLPGALSLPFDIHANQCSLATRFDHFFIDAGTGLSAIAMLLGMPLANLTGIAHVVLMADSSELFEEKLLNYKRQLERTLSCALALPQYRLYRPSTSRSFGSINKQISQEIHLMATKEGILCDPIYTAKLFYSAKAIQQQHSLEGNILCMHSGGGLSLSGFMQLI